MRSPIPLTPLLCTLLPLLLSACGQVDNGSAPASAPTRSESMAQYDRGAESLPMPAAGAVMEQALLSTAPAEMGDREMPALNTEEYAHIDENPFLLARDNPLSTFSIDVDTASYANVRRFIEQGSLPYADAVRIEEMVNYFDYDYPEPASGPGEPPFSLTTELAACPWQSEHRLLHIGLKAHAIATEDLPPSNLVFLLDVSGSMAAANKLPLLKSALRLLVGELRRQDRVAIVVYAGAAGVVLNPTSGEAKEAILSALDQLEAGGSTAGGAGLQLAYKLARDQFEATANNRVILATDGDFNVGPSSEGELLRLIEKQRESGIYLTVLGFGSGNYKDSKMEQLANHGNGNFAYIDSLLEARKVLVQEMGGTLVSVANDVKAQIEFNPIHVEAYRLLGYENRLLRAEDFDDDAKDAGEMGAGHTVTVLYEIRPAQRAASAGRPLRYQQSEVTEAARRSEELGHLAVRYKEPGQLKSLRLDQPILDHPRSLDKSSDNFRFSAAIAEWGMLLRDSAAKGEATYAQAIALARGARGDDPHGYRNQALRLMELSASLSGQNRAE